MLHLERRSVLAGGAALLLSTAAHAQPTQPTPRRGGVLRIALANNPGSLDPITGRTVARVSRQDIAHIRIGCPMRPR